MRYLIIFVLFLANCVSTSTVKLSSDSYPAKAENCDIDVITQRPDKKFKELILLNVRGSVRLKLQGLMPDIKKETCLAGGDAVIIKPSRNAGQTVVHAIVIKFSD